MPRKHVSEDTEPPIFVHERCYDLVRVVLEQLDKGHVAILPDDGNHGVCLASVTHRAGRESDAHNVAAAYHSALVREARASHRQRIGRREDAVREKGDVADKKRQHPEREKLLAGDSEFWRRRRNKYSLMVCQETCVDSSTRSPCAVHVPFLP